MKKIVVIGSGILGAAATYQLAKQGVEVINVDRDEEGQATKAAAGIICPWLAQRRNKAWYQLADGGARYYPKLIEELQKDGETNTGYKRVGMLGLFQEDKKLHAALERVLKRKENSPEIGEVHLLNEEETKDKFPLVDEGYRSIHIGGGARVDGNALRHSLIRAAEKHGATFVKGNAKLLNENNKVIGVTVNDETIKAHETIATTGAWMNELFEPLKIAFQAYPQKAQIIHLSYQGDQKTDNWPVIMPPNNQYILPSENNRIIIGATHETAAGFDLQVTAGGVHEVLDKALQIAPPLSSCTLLETKVGFRPFTPGSLPVIGRLPHESGLILGNGLGASGLTMGPFVGKILASLALDETVDIDLSQYDVAHAIQ